MASKPTLDDLLRADQARAEATAKNLPRRQNNPFMPEPTPRSGITYKDDVGNTAVANVMRQQRDQR